MKKSFLTTSKKVLLATSILAMSATAIAATDAQRMTDSTVIKTLTVSANYVETLAMTLNTSTINFGDVFTGATVTPETVIANVKGDIDESFTYKIETSGSNVLLALTSGGGSVTTNVINGTAIATNNTSGTDLTFTVGLETTGLATAVANETVTVTVSYDAIATTVKV
jgi:hypothetical protein